MYPYTFVKPRRRLDLPNMAVVYLPEKEEKERLWNNFLSTKTQYEKDLQNRISHAENIIIEDLKNTYKNLKFFPQQMFVYQYKLDVSRKIRRFIQPDAIAINEQKKTVVIFEIKRNRKFRDEVQRLNVMDLVKIQFPDHTVVHKYIYSDEHIPTQKRLLS
jgi:hypothetical protein